MSGRLSTYSVNRLSTISGKVKKTVNQNQEKTLFCQKSALNVTNVTHNILKFNECDIVTLKSKKNKWEALCFGLLL
jgi:hypothetical protein